MKSENKIGDWTLLGLAPTRNRKKYWKVQCSCGIIKEVAEYSLKKGKSKSCKVCSYIKKTGNVPNINDVYYNYKVIDIIIKGTRTFINLQCKCGYITQKKIGMHYNAKQCRNCYTKQQKGRIAFNRTGYKGISGTYWGALKAGAKLRSLTFSITKKDVWELFIKQDKKCALSGIPLKLSYKEKTASLDRINSNKGYIINNLQWTLIEINYMKYKLTQERFLELCKKIADENNR